MVALPHPSFEPKTHRWCPGAGAPSREVPSQNCAFCAPKGRFWPQTAPKPSQNGQTKRNGRYTPRAPQLPLTKSPFVPSSSTICPRNGPKMAKNGWNVRHFCQTGPKPRTGRILGYVAQNRIPGALIPPATPHFMRFPSRRIAQRDAYTPVLVVTWWSPRAVQPAQREGHPPGIHRVSPGLVSGACG